MKLSKKYLKCYRNVFKQKFEEYPFEGERLKIDDDVLTQLLFDTVVTEVNGESVKKKIIAWSGDFLRKVDLSKISFENVDWNYEKDRAVDLSYTNAKIDFSKSFEVLHPKTKNSKATISHVNLECVELESSNCNYLGKISCCNLVGTHFKINPKVPQLIRDCNLHGNKHESTKIPVAALCQVPSNNNKRQILSLFNTNLCYTRLEFFASPEDLKDETINSALVTAIRAGHLWGCYVNGNYLENPQFIKEKKVQEFNKMKAVFDDELKKIKPNNKCLKLALPDNN